MQHNIATQLQTSASLPSEALQECQWEVHAAPNRTDVPCNTGMEGSAYISNLLITKIFSCPGANRPFSCKYASVVAHSTCGTANSVSVDILLAGLAAAVMQCHEISRIGNGWHGPTPSIGRHIPSHVITEYLRPCCTPARPVAYLGSEPWSAQVCSGWLVPKSSRAFDLRIFYDFLTHSLGFPYPSVLSVLLYVLCSIISIGIVSRLDSSKVPWELQLWDSSVSAS